MSGLHECLDGGAVHEIRNLEKDGVWEGRLRVWFVRVVNKFVTVIDDRTPHLLSLL